MKKNKCAKKSTQTGLSRLSSLTPARLTWDTSVFVTVDDDVGVDDDDKNVETWFVRVRLHAVEMVVPEG